MLSPHPRGSAHGAVGTSALLPRRGKAIKTALLFPGQGSQTEAIREAVERHRPDLLELAVREVGGDPFARLEEGTRFAQPALFCASVAGWSRLGLDEADFLAGHSLGELAALVAAGSLSAADGLRLVALRGRVMQEAAERSPGAPEGMLAVLGAEAGALANPIAALHGVAIANDNAPDQVVLSGGDLALDAAAADVEEAGLRAMRLPVKGAFHSPSMTSAVPEFAAALADTHFEPPRAPVLSCVTARPFDDVPRRLAEGLTHPVRWRETLLTLHERGVRRFVETGPGKVLTGLVRRTLRGVDAVAADQLESVHA